MAELTGALLFAAFGMAASIASLALGLGSVAEPGAGFLPFWAGAMMAGCAAVIAVRSVLQARAPVSLAEAPTPTADDRSDDERRRGALRAAGCLLALSVYALLLPRLGFLGATFIVMFALSRLDPITTWRESLVIAGVGGGAFWLLFVELLGVSFPPAWLGL